MNYSCPVASITLLMEAPFFSKSLIIINKNDFNASCREFRILTGKIPGGISEEKMLEIMRQGLNQLYSGGLA